MSRLVNYLLIPLVLYAILACARGQNVILGNVVLNGYVQTAPVPFVNCVFTPSYSCPQLPNLFNADPYSTSGTFTGYADSTLRADPNTGTIWMAYSWPKVQTNGSLGISNHLSYFDGTNWQFSNSVYTSATITNGATGQTNYVSNEVPALFLDNISGTTYSYQAGLWYAVAPGQAGYSNQPSTNRIFIRGASGAPSNITATGQQYLGGNAVDATNFPISQNLSTLVPAPICNRFNEPTLSKSGSTLYLTMGCSDPFQYQLYTFSTSTPQTCVLANNCTWAYVSKFITPAESNGTCGATFGSLCGANNLISSCEMAKSVIPGNLVMICEMSTGGMILGPIAFSMASLTPAAFNYGPSGLPVVLGWATCSQCGSSGPEVGPGYEPTYPGGAIITLQQTGCPTSGCGTTPGTFNQLVSLPGIRP